MGFFEFLPIEFAACWKPPGRNIIVYHLNLIQGRNNVTRVRVEPRSCDQGRRWNAAFTLSATLPTNTKILSDFQYRDRYQTKFPIRF